MIAAPPSADAPSPREEVRLALTEALLLLSASSDVSESMREQGVAPVLLAAHRQEEVQRVRAVNKQLVAVLNRAVPAGFKSDAPAVPAEKLSEKVAQLEVDDDAVRSEEVDD